LHVREIDHNARGVEILTQTIQPPRELSVWCLVKTATNQNGESENGDIPKRRQKAWPKRRQTKTVKVKTATRNGCTVRGLQALISYIDCETIDV